MQVASSLMFRGSPPLGYSHSCLTLLAMSSSEGRYRHNRDNQKAYKSRQPDQHLGELPVSLGWLRMLLSLNNMRREGHRKELEKSGGLRWHTRLVQF